MHIEQLGRGFAWLDTGTHQSLVKASQFIETIEERQGLKVACIEEIAFHLSYINEKQLKQLAMGLISNDYGKYLLNIVQQNDRGYPIESSNILINKARGDML